MSSGVARNHAQVHGMDQVMLGLTVLRLGLRWRALSDTNNFPVISFLPQNFDAEKLAPVDVLHYHDSMSPELLPRLLDAIRPAHPEVAEWLAPQGPVNDPASRIAAARTRGPPRHACGSAPLVLRTTRLHQAHPGSALSRGSAR